VDDGTGDKEGDGVMGYGNLIEYADATPEAQAVMDEIKARAVCRT